MNSYLAGTDVTVEVPLTDPSGSTIPVTSIQYRVTDSNDTEVVALTSLASYAPYSASASITLAANLNQLPTGFYRDLRHIDLQCLVGSNVIALSASYIIEKTDVLEIGVTSFQSMTQAEFNATLMPNLPGWETASNDEKIAAMIDARLHICQLNFSPLNNNKLWGQDSLNFVPEGSFTTNYAVREGSFAWGGNLTFVKKDQFLKLPELFRRALNNAQIAEADNILGGDPLEAARKTGLILDTVGDSKQMYRSGKPLDLPCSRRALSYVSQFVSFSKRIARQ